MHTSFDIYYTLRSAAKASGLSKVLFLHIRMFWTISLYVVVQ